MVKLEEATRNRLRFLQRTNKDKRVFIKVTVLLMLDQGLEPPTVAISLGIDLSSVYRYLARFESVGLDAYLKDNYVAYVGELSAEQQAALKRELTENLHINTAEVAAFIQHRFGVAYTHSGVAKLLHRLGFVYKKTKTVPAKADPVRQQAFVQQLETLLETADDEHVIYFNDAVHPQHNTRADYGWILAGDTFAVPANSGRDKVNLTGALNAHDPTDVVVADVERVNAQATVALWECIENQQPGREILHICDNAAYYRCRVVTDWLAVHPRTTVLFLPPYSPNLNLIERLWKYLRKTVISYHYYQHFDDFRRAILQFFQNIKEHRSALERLLTPKFHIIEFY